LLRVSSSRGKQLHQIAGAGAPSSWALISRSKAVVTASGDPGNNEDHGAWPPGQAALCRLLVRCLKESTRNSSPNLDLVFVEQVDGQGCVAAGEAVPTTA